MLFLFGMLAWSFQILIFLFIPWEISLKEKQFGLMNGLLASCIDQSLCLTATVLGAGLSLFALIMCKIQILVQ